jgi:hypothetical protein
VVTKTELDDRLARLMPEKELQGKLHLACIQILAPIGGAYSHTHRSQHSPAGVPDVIVSFPTGHLVVTEAKATCRCRPGRAQCDKHPSASQVTWLRNLGANPLTIVLTGIGGEYGIVRPIDYYSRNLTALLLDARNRITREAAA